METANLTYIKNLSGGDISFEEKIITILKSELPEEQKTYFFCLQNKNYKDTAEIVHKLKHKISILGLKKSYQIAVEFEENLLKGTPMGKDDFEKILMNMTKFVEQL